MKAFRGLSLALAGALVMTVSAAAQGPGASPFTPAMMKKFQAFRESHKNVRAVGQTLRAIEEMQRDPKSKFTKPQATKILAVLKTWRNKPVMTDPQASKVNKQLTGVFTMAQLKKLATMQQRGGRRGGGRPGGMGGPGGPGGPGGMGGARRGGPGGPGGRPGGGRNFDPKLFLRETNPLNPNSSPIPEMRQRSAERLNELTKSLAAAK